MSIIFNQIYTIYNNFKTNIYMKYILYTQIFQDIIFNDTFQILISQILYQYTKLKSLSTTLSILKYNILNL